MATRDQLFEATIKLTQILGHHLGTSEAFFDDTQLTDLIQVALKVPGFTEAQKALIVRSSCLDQRQFDLSPLAIYWPFSTLGIKKGAPEEVVKVKHPYLKYCSFLSGITFLDVKLHGRYECREAID